MRKAAAIALLATLSAGCSSQGLDAMVPGQAPPVGKEPSSNGPCPECVKGHAAVRAIQAATPARILPPSTSSTTAGSAPATSTASSTGGVPSMANLKASGVVTKCLKQEISQATCQTDGLPYG